ncbi:MAG: organomercurial lyase [Candidatus Kariarchaeaceae archaeon]
MNQLDNKPDKNDLLQLHLSVLKELLNGINFDEIKEKYKVKFKELNYLKLATGSLLTFNKRKLIAAYPVSPHKSSYEVTIEDVGKGYAMCAIDALGIAYTFMKKTKIESMLVDTSEPFTFEIDPFVPKYTPLDLYVTYKRYSMKETNVALEICPSIDIYRSKNNIPKDENMVVIDFETALRYAKERFSQQAITQCFGGSLDTDKMIVEAQNSTGNCNC